MQNIFVGIIIFLSAIVQTSFLSNFFPANMTPDLVLILIIIWTAKANFNSALFKTIFAGLTVDFLSFGVIGINVFSFVFVSYMADSLCKRFFVTQFGRKFLLLAVMVMLGTIVNYVIIIIFMKIILNQSNFSWHTLGLFDWNIILKPVYNLGIFMVLYWPLKKIDRIFSQQNKVIIKR
jgi:rod shape-determining protein MreD